MYVRIPPGGRAGRERSHYDRAMAIRVECHAGYRGDQEPRVFWLGERRWVGPDYRHFRVAASDGDTYILRHDDNAGEWDLAAFRRGP